MSDFTIIPKDQIEEKHWVRADEIVSFWLHRDDSEIGDLIWMIAEGFQALENIREGKKASLRRYQAEDLSNTNQ